MPADAVDDAVHAAFGIDERDVLVVRANTAGV
jgi:hypothetical protein